VNLAELPWVENSAEFGGFAVGVDGVTVPLSSVSVSVEESVAEAGCLQAAVGDREPAIGSSASRVARPDALQLLVCTHELTYGGAQLFLAELLRRIGSEIAVEGLVVAPVDGPTRTLLRREGFDVHVTTPYPISFAEEYDM